ncbi:MAG: hypothetical protein GQ582_09190 [Methyloprofundus sp.]|nr:hypothetical protein [Methyloprofundus sp.]
MSLSILGRNYLKTGAKECLINKVLSLFFILIFTSIASGCILKYLKYDGWSIGDWLINYQGGFIRRGFLGEFFYQVSIYTHINPGFYVLLLQIFLYAIILYFSYCLLKNDKNLLSYIFLIFSPYIFTFHIYNDYGGIRKEIIFVAILVFIVYLANLKDDKVFEKYFYRILLFYPLVILTHEMLAVFLPYIIAAYVIKNNGLTIEKSINIGLLLIPSIVSFIAVLYYSGNSLQVDEIFNSLAKANYPVEGGAIDWLDKGVSFGISALDHTLIDLSISDFLIMVLVSFIAYIPIYKKVSIIIKNKPAFGLVMTSIVGSLVLFFIAIDWGRFLYVHLIAFFLLSLLIESDENSFCIKNKLNVIPLLLLFIAYSSLWTVPFCCGPQTAYTKSYKENNFFQFMYPSINLIIHFFPEKKFLFCASIFPLLNHCGSDAAALPSQVGSLLNKGRIARQGIDKQGYLTFGPYAKLLTGEYEFDVHYKSTLAATVNVGEWDVVISNGDDKIQALNTGKITGTDGLEKHIVKRFIVPKEFSGKNIEIRNFYNGKGDLIIYYLGIRKID